MRNGGKGVVALLLTLPLKPPYIYQQFYMDSNSNVGINIKQRPVKI
jgi:hypothetical protein